MRHLSLNRLLRGLRSRPLPHRGSTGCAATRWPRSPRSPTSPPR